MRTRPGAGSLSARPSRRRAAGLQLPEGRAPEAYRRVTRAPSGPHVTRTAVTWRRRGSREQTRPRRRRDPLRGGTWLASQEGVVVRPRPGRRRGGAAAAEGAAARGAPAGEAAPLRWWSRARGRRATGRGKGGRARSAPRSRGAEGRGRGEVLARTAGRTAGRARKPGPAGSGLARSRDRPSSPVEPGRCGQPRQRGCFLPVCSTAVVKKASGLLLRSPITFCFCFFLIRGTVFIGSFLIR